MSDSLFDTSEEKNNFTRLARLIIDGGTYALREFLHSIYPATALPTVLQKNKPLFQILKNRRKLFDDQWERLYPSSGDPPDTKTFDITLLHLLLREICVLTDPSTGWHEMPADEDTSNEAHIVRIKCYRNDLCHSISTGIPNDEFERKWATISRSLVALGVDSREIDRLKTETIDHDTKARIQEIMKYSWEPRISNVEDKVQQLEGQLLSFNLQEACNPVELYSCLPDEAQDVFGRTAEIQEATQAIQSGKFSVVVITGAPGFGKTTVANKVAYELAKPHNGRTVFYISLKSKATLNDVTTSMFLACSTNQSHPLDNSQLWLLNWSKQQSTSVTFVLDYADHSATECQGSGSVVDLMREMRALSRQKISFVVASRRTIQAGRSQLKIKEVTLHSLWPDDAEKLLLSKVSSEGKRQKLKQTKKMVELCACVPLALCIAGSLLLDYEEDNLISRLEKEPLEVIVDDEMSLKKTIQTSFDLLNPQEQKALAILSIFPGFFDSNAAEAVISAATGSEAQSIRILRSLKTWSLLEQASSGRYHVHQLIQAFASKTGRERFRDIFKDLEMVACSHFVCRLSENSEMYWSKDRCKDSIEAFNENRHNFEYFLDVFAVAMSVKPRIDPVLEKAANKFLQQLPQKCMYLELCLLPSFYTKIGLHNLLRHFYTGNQPVHTVELLCFLSNEKRRVGDQKEYFDLFEQAKDIYRRNYAEFRANGLSQVLFFNSYARFLFEKCLSRELCNAVFEIALDLSEKKLADHPERAATLLLIGKNRKRIPVLQEATSSFGNHLGEHFMTAQGHKAIADVYFAHRHTETDLNMAMFHYEQAFAIMAKCGMGDRKESILTLKNYAVCHRRKGNYEDAIRILAKARHVAEVELKRDHKWKVSIETQRALLYEDSGMLEEAKKIMISALKMCQRLGQPINRLGNKDEIHRFMAYHNCYPENKEILRKPRK